MKTRKASGKPAELERLLATDAATLSKQPFPLVDFALFFSSLHSISACCLQRHLSGSANAYNKQLQFAALCQRIVDVVNFGLLSYYTIKYK